MKEKINVFDYAELITKTLRPGILLNSYGDKFNSMVIGWGHLGVIWGLDTFCVYVRNPVTPRLRSTRRASLRSAFRCMEELILKSLNSATRSPAETSTRLII